MTNNDRIIIDIRDMTLDCGHPENPDRPGIHCVKGELLCTDCLEYA